VDKVLDADQHYYEARDAFTRYLPPEWSARTVREAVIDGKLRHIVGGRVEMTVNNPTFNPIVRPGALMDFFRGNPSGLKQTDYLRNREPLPACYHNRDARLATMDTQGLEAIWLLPSLAMAYEEALQNDPLAAAAAFRAFNRWLLDDWGFVYRDRIYAAPYLAMGAIDEAVQELEWMLANDARIVVVRPSGILTATGWRSPGDSCFDPIWARLAEAGVTLVPHVGEVGSHGLDRYEPHATNIIHGASSPLEVAVGHERPIANYLGALVCGRVFERFPSLQVASLENGSEFLPLLLRGLRRAMQQRPGYFRDDPVDAFKEHVWVAPFWEDSLIEVVAEMGPDRVLFGSDWPHPEGLIAPLDYEAEADLLNPADRVKVMYENAAALCRHKQIVVEGALA
jgi:predicted TIM-barrel fold metal-dependent hydrolase